MKKVITAAISVVIALCASLSFAACGGKTEGGTTIIKDLVLVKEEYGIAGRKEDRSLVSEINDALIGLSSSGMKTIADKYGLTGEIAVTPETVNPIANATDGGFEKIKNSGKIIIGYTIYAPIAYTDDNGEFVGFDTELAKAAIKYINEKYDTDIKVEFQLIQWASKETNLNDGTIDPSWNGLTITEERKENMCVSVPYLYNNQVAVIRKADENEYTADLSSFANAIMGAEKGSAGESVINEKALGKERLTFKSQLDAYNQLKAGSIDVAVIDSVMANYYISKDN